MVLDDTERNVPRRVGLHDLHELALVHVFEVGGRADDSRVGEEDVEAPVPRHGLVDDALDGGLVGGVELPHVHVDFGVELAQVALVRGQIAVVEVAEVEGAGAALGELVRGGAADAEDGVGACGLGKKGDVNIRLLGRVAGTGIGQLGAILMKELGGIPVIMATFPESRGPFEEPAMRFGAEAPLLFVAGDSCLPRASIRSLAVLVMVAVDSYSCWLKETSNRIYWIT